MLLDTASLYFRAFYGVPDSMTAPDGTPINAVRGLIDMMATLIREYRPAELVACWDNDWRPEFRVAALPSYKSHRLGGGGRQVSRRDPAVAHGGASKWMEDVPEKLAVQVPIISEVLAALGIARVGVDGYEADDVIGSYAARRAATKGPANTPGDAVTGAPMDIVTGDRDLFQLVDDSVPIRILYTARGIRRLEIIDEAAVLRKYGIPGTSYADFAVLRGDPSDGLPGVKGVGDKTAAALITRFGSLAAILEALDAGQTDGFPAGTRVKIDAARDYLAVAPAVVQVATDVPLPDIETATPNAPADPERLVELADRWDLDSPLGRLLSALAAS